MLHGVFSSTATPQFRREMVSGRRSALLLPPRATRASVATTASPRRTSFYNWVSRSRSWTFWITVLNLFDNLPAMSYTPILHCFIEANAIAEFVASFVGLSYLLLATGCSSDQGSPSTSKASEIGLYAAYHSPRRDTRELAYPACRSTTPVNDALARLDSLMGEGVRGKRSLCLRTRRTDHNSGVFSGRKISCSCPTARDALRILSSSRG